MHHIHVKRVSQRSVESRAFSPGTPVFSHPGNLTGWLGQSVTEKTPKVGSELKLYLSIYLSFAL